MKTTKISIIILLVLCFLLVIGLGGLLCVGIYNKDFLKKYFVVNTDKKVLYNDYQPANKIKIETSTYDVNFYYHDDDRILVKVTGAEEDNADIYTSEDTLNINVKTKKRFGFFVFNIINNKIDIYLPRNYELPISATLSTGDVKFKEQSNSEFNIKTSTGDIYLRNAKNSKLQASTGDITITEDFDGGSIKVSTGDIKIKNASGKIDLKASTGEIKIKKVNLTESSTIKTSTGDVKIDKVNDIYITAKASTGDVVTKYSNRFSDIELNIKTSTGDITTGKLSE